MSIDKFGVFYEYWLAQLPHESTRHVPLNAKGFGAGSTFALNSVALLQQCDFDDNRLLEDTEFQCAAMALFSGADADGDGKVAPGEFCWNDLCVANFTYQNLAQGFQRAAGADRLMLPSEFLAWRYSFMAHWAVD